MPEEIEEIAPEEVPAAEEGEDPKAKRLTPEQWAEIEAHCAYNTMSNRDMMVKYEISRRGLRKHFERMMEKGTPIERGSKAHLLAAKTAAAIGVKVSAAAAAAPVASAFNEKRKENIEWSKTTLFQQDRNNQIMIMKVQKEIQAGTRTAADGFADMKTLNLIARALLTTRQNRYVLLDIANDIDEAALPKLIFEDLNDEEIALMQKSDAGGEDDFDFEDPAEGDDEVVEEGGE